MAEEKNVIPLLPMGVMIPCWECGNHAYSIWWFMSARACPNCGEPWVKQAREIEGAVYD